jgi:cellulose synthase/poly-beta-1,6-N-acetylglucosamine synthase-like glycosyltransferase
MYTDILKNLWAITAIVLIVRILLFVVLSLTHFLHSRYKHRAERLHHYAPHVSVLVPAYNEEQVLTNCIEGLLNQTYQNYDIVIINDGSKDRTALIGERLAEIYKERIILIKKRTVVRQALSTTDSLVHRER